VRRSAAILGLVAACALLLITPPPLPAAPGTGVLLDQRCDFISSECWSTRAERGSVFLRMESSDHGGEYRVCVTPPRAKRACRAVRLRHRPPGKHGYVGFAAGVDAGKFVDLSAAGQYRVLWFSEPGGLRFGPTLAFTLRADGEPVVG
jgi:hypothetical protein